MSDNKNYYYLKLKDNFFDSDEIKILEKMENGYKYSNILLKLYLKSLKFHGALRLNEYIPYNITMVAALTGHDVDTVRVSLKVFEDLKLIETLDNGTIYMLNVQSLIGKSSTEADRKRLYRLKIEEEKKLIISGTNNGQMSKDCPLSADKNPPELELDIKDKDRDITRDKDRDIDIAEEKERIPWQDILTAWNALPEPIKPITAITANRKYKVQARLNGLEIKASSIFLAINNIKNSDFLMGKNQKGWIIAFDWLFKDDTRFSKVLEGNYDNSKGPEGKVTGQTDTFNNYNQRSYDGSDGGMTLSDIEKKLLGRDKKEN